MEIKPTGEQFTIAHGRYGAVVTEVGATLRSLTKDDEEVLWTFPEDGLPRSSSGRQLVPWPNRIRDGRYRFGGQEHQLPITEVARHNAIHGLATSVAWRTINHTAGEVVSSVVLYPTKGWQAVVEVEVGHRLDDEGLTVTVQACNAGREPAPFGYGAHPFAAADLATSTLGFPFTQELVVDERLLPIRLGPVSPERDFTTVRPVGETVLDTAFTGSPGGWQVQVCSPQRTVVFWTDEHLPWGQIYTNATRDGIAVEPMTCGPDAFNEGPTHEDLIILEPGQSARCRWGIRVS